MPLEKKLLGDTAFCALDLETTGANPAMHRLIEIGMVAFTLQKDLKSYESLVDPEMPISPQAQDIHGISSERLVGEPKIKDILQEVISFFGDTVLVIHNPFFDLAFITRACQESGIEPPAFISVDTVTLARSAFPELENHRLNTLCHYLNIDLAHHQALSDAAACMEVFRKCCGALNLGTMSSLDDLWQYHGNPITEKELKSLGPESGSVEGIKEGCAVTIRYRDFKGMITERKILPAHIVRYGKKNYIKAFCYLRREERFFRAERIIEII